jgi:hypothetical protein
MTNVTPAPVIDPILSFYAVVTSTAIDGAPPGEHVWAMAGADGNVFPMIATKELIGKDMLRMLTESTDPDIQGKTFRLIHIHGKRHVLREVTI